MFAKRLLAVSILIAILMLNATQAEPGHPQRPERFTSEEQVRKYLQDLKQYYEENLRRGRYGKRNYIAPANLLFKSYPKPDEQSDWKTEYDYYTQYNI